MMLKELNKSHVRTLKALAHINNTQGPADAEALAARMDVAKHTAIFYISFLIKHGYAEGGASRTFSITEQGLAAVQRSLAGA